jgi:hypothetical protein
MEKSAVLRDQISEFVSSLPDTDKAAFLDYLLGPLKAELQSLISEEGFNALLNRSIYLTRQHHSFLKLPPSELASPLQFDVLASDLEYLEPSKAREAITAVVLTLIDLLTSMIGEFLTIEILCAAWGKDSLGIIGEESQQ